MDALMYCAYVYTKHAIYVFDKKTKLIDAINNDNQLTASSPLYLFRRQIVVFTNIMLKVRTMKYRMFWTVLFSIL